MEEMFHLVLLSILNMVRIYCISLKYHVNVFFCQISGPEPPGFSDSDSDSDDTDYVVGPGNSVAINSMPSTATCSSMVPADASDSSDNGSGVYITSGPEDNSIKLRVTGASSSDDGTDERERKS